MTRTIPSIRPATEAELPAVGRVLAAAFADDPVWDWICAPGRNGSADAARWFAAEARAKQRGHGEVLVDDQLRGAALWAPHEHWQGTARELAAILVPSLRLFRTRTFRALAIQRHMEKVHLREPHWYLAVLGTHPDHQGHGVGSSLITAVTDRCDEEGLAAYLESSKERNVPFYERHGFVVTERVSVRDSPPLWLMRREPR